jgi:hypothetical protein
MISLDYIEKARSVPITCSMVQTTSEAKLRDASIRQELETYDRVIRECLGDHNSSDNLDHELA